MISKKQKIDLSNEINMARYRQENFYEFQKIKFQDIIKNINSTTKQFQEIYNCIYISKEKIWISWKWRPDVFDKLDNIKLQHQNFYQIEFDEKNIDIDYLIYQIDKFLYVNVKLAPYWSYTEHKNMLTQKEIMEMTIKIPPLLYQENIITSHKKIDTIISRMKKYKWDTILHTKHIDIILDKITNVLDSLDELSKAEKAINLIKKGEWLTTEFKETFSKDIQSWKKEKYIEESSLKNIVWFMNKKWWTLLIGISDSGTITWIEQDIYQSDDKYLLHFKNKIKESIGEEYFSYLEYNIILIDDKKILMVECEKTLKPVYLYGKDFYVRNNPSTDKLEWPTLVEYIKTHWKE